MHAKNIWMAKQRENCKLKYSWLAKTNSDGTSIFFLFHALDSMVGKNYWYTEEKPETFVTVHRKMYFNDFP